MKKVVTKKAADLPPDLLLARFTPVPAAFADMKVATLKMPYGLALWRFSQWLENYLKRETDSDGDPTPRKLPYRLLNAALVACAPTLAHGFEWYDDKANSDKGYRLLAVAKPDATLAYPSAVQVAGVMRQWIRAWHDGADWLRQAVVGEKGADEWAKLLSALREPPDTDWRTDHDPLDLFRNGGNLDGGLAYHAVPCLIATLLHGTESVIRERTVRWRRMQEGGPHLCLLSDPIPVSITRAKEERDGDNRTVRTTESHDAFFCYRVEARLHTQAGLEMPWVYVRTHCTRIAHSPLLRNERGTEITLLSGANTARITGWENDTTLVRLKASKNPGAAQWLDNLPDLLARLEARPLPAPAEVLTDPPAFWRTEEDGLPHDEYYVVHTEGYKYAEHGKRRVGHAVYSGLPLPEQAEIVGSLTCGFLRDALLPDQPLAADPFRFDAVEGNGEPDVLRDIDELRRYWGDPAAKRTGATLEREEARLRYRDLWRPKVADAIRRGTRGRRLVIPCFYSSAHTLEWVRRGLWHESFLLADGDPAPEGVVFLPVPIPADLADLVRPCPAGSDGNPPRYAAIKAWREEMRLRWAAFLDETIGTYLADSDALVSAVVELDRENDPKRFRKENLPASADAHGLIREAFARHGGRVQMTLPFRKPTNSAQLNSGPKGKAQNVAQEVVTRQLGAVFGRPAELYRAVGMDDFGSLVSDDLDVIAFSLRNTHTGIRYCLATRLRANGEVDVLLPGDDCVWIPYADACAELGKLFCSARKFLLRSGKLGDGRSGGPPCPLRLKPWDMAAFVRSVLTTRAGDKPTLALIEAEKWRQPRDGGGGWGQLTNPALAANRDALIFPNGKDKFRHDRQDLALLLGVIRLRSGDETPGYATNRRDWRFDDMLPMPNYAQATGFVDCRPDIFHYLSVNGVATTNAKQPQYTLRGKKPFFYKSEGSEHAFKHAPVIEMVPFCVAQQFDHPDGEGLKALCRVAHYLRVHPGWGLGEVNSPYPLHLGDTLIRDQETILGVG
jgi:hypothetical protein